MEELFGSNKECIESLVSVIKERIENSFFEEEKKEFYSGLKILKLSIDKYLLYSLPLITIVDGKVTTLTSNIGGSALAKHMSKLKITPELENKLQSFGRLQFKFNFLLYQYYKQTGLDKRGLKHIASTALKTINDYITMLGLDDGLIPNSISKVKQAFETELSELVAEGVEDIRFELTDPNNPPLLESTATKSYWLAKHSSEKKQKLHDQLLEKELILENPKFLKKFEGISPAKELRTVWKGKETQIVFLFLRLLDDKELDNNLPFHMLIPILFLKEKNVEFTENSLRSTYNQIRHRLAPNAKLTPALRVVQDIVDSL